MLALACLWLIGSSPWLAMFAGISLEAGWINLSHTALGLAVLPLVLIYAAACCHGGRWRLYFPWLTGDIGALGRDLKGLGRGERPMSEGGGLFAAIEGLLLLALLAAAISGAAWFLTQGTDAVFDWWLYHRYAARALAGVLVLHVTAVSLHLVDLIGN
ncbi:MAG: hypothetical protein RR101_05615 [Burkholderiaceae bacterium]